MAALERLLHDRLAPAFEAVAGAPADPSLRRSQYADFQADGARWPAGWIVTRGR